RLTRVPGTDCPIPSGYPPLPGRTTSYPRPSAVPSAAAGPPPHFPETPPPGSPPPIPTHCPPYLPYPSHYFLKNPLKNFTFIIRKNLSMLHTDLTQRIIGCAMKVHRTLGNGFQEVIYQRALAIELRNNQIEAVR